MEPLNIAKLFTALRGGTISEITEDLSEGSRTLRFRIHLPEVAAQLNPDFLGFFGVLEGCTMFSLQPFRNENAVVDQLSQIERLGILIEEGQAKGERVHVFCGHKGASSGARLTIRATQFQVMSEEFDRMTAGELAELRS